ncbi:MAG: M15 family metallopeptidase [Alphaproteobacteria bacterium]|nr:M15 family metallopeptidase [Alphaproteobacteria bacterium]
MSHELEYFISIPDSLTNTADYRKIPIDLTSPRAAEPLVRLSDYKIAGKSYYARTDGKNAPYFEKIPGALKHLWARETVAEKLARVNELLRPHNVELFVWDAYRSIECQRGLWDFLVKKTEQDMPGASREEIRTHALSFFSNPHAFDIGDPHTWPVHACGGAVDVTLRKRSSRRLLDMGAAFDETGEMAFSHALELKARSGEIKADDPRLLNRRLLHWAMDQEGFVNFSAEFWHFDFGDQMYILHSQILKRPLGTNAAWYGYVPSPEQPR